LAASWKPLMKSKTSATKMMTTTAVSTGSACRHAILRMMPSITLATSSHRSVTISIVS
jgi:hypothetical protein